MKTVGPKSEFSAIPENQKAEESLERLSRAIDAVATLKEHNAHLKRLIEEFNNGR